jgi:hypothetical protein
MRTVRRVLSNERGSVVVIVAVSLMAMLAMAALAIDLAALRDARGEAQRSADAIALAGATAFKDASFKDPAAITDARDRALQIARLNKVRLDTIDIRSFSNLIKVTKPWGDVYTLTTPSNQLELNIIPDSQRVRAWVRHANLATWFGGMLAKPYSHVQAMATAQVTEAGEARCVKPLALPDIWHEASATQDLNVDDVWDQNEPWDFDPASGDTYAQYNPESPDPSQTGYGSAWRDASGVTADWGRPMTIKAQRPSESPTSGWFFPWRIGESNGANDYRNNITGCSEEAHLGEPYNVETGNMVGPTIQAFGDVIAEDPGAHWDTSLNGGTGGITGSSYGDWRDSPRVIPIALFDPNQIAGIRSGGNLHLTFNNFALFFVEGFEGQGQQKPLKGRFLYYATGSGVGPVTGPLTKILQLVE